MTFFCSVYALQVLPLVETAVILNLMPILVGILCYLILKEALNKVDILCLGISIIGVVILLANQKNSEFVRHEGQVSYEMALLLILITAIVCSYSCITLRRMKGMNSMVPSLYIAFAASGIYSVLSIFFEKKGHIFEIITWSEGLLFAIAGVLCSF